MDNPKVSFSHLLSCIHVLFYLLIDIISIRREICDEAFHVYEEKKLLKTTDMNVGKKADMKSLHIMKECVCVCV